MFEDFLESSTPVDYAKGLIDVKNPNQNREIAAEIKDRIPDLKDRIEKMSETEKKKKNAEETLKIIKEILEYNKRTRKTFPVASKVDKGKSEPKPEERILKESIPKWVQVSEERFKIMKLEINTNKNLGTTIDNKRYTLNEANELVNKIAKQKIGKNKATKA